jgi:hypothetical protein
MCRPVDDSPAPGAHFKCLHVMFGNEMGRQSPLWWRSVTPGTTTETQSLSTSAAWWCLCHPGDDTCGLAVCTGVQGNKQAEYKLPDEVGGVGEAETLGKSGVCIYFDTSSTLIDSVRDKYNSDKLLSKVR